MAAGCLERPVTSRPCAFGVGPGLCLIAQCMVRAAHLIGVSGDELLPHKVGPENSLDVFKQFYVNKFADHHAHEIAF